MHVPAKSMLDFYGYSPRMGKELFEFNFGNSSKILKINFIMFKGGREILFRSDFFINWEPETLEPETSYEINCSFLWSEQRQSALV